MSISFLYMFRATMCPSSGETTVFATLCTCYSVWKTVWYAGAYASAYQTITCTSERRMLRLVNTEAEGSCNKVAVVLLNLSAAFTGRNGENPREISLRMTEVEVTIHSSRLYIYRVLFYLTNIIC